MPLPQPLLEQLTTPAHI